MLSRNGKPASGPKSPMPSGDTFVPDGRHTWLRVTPDKITSWDFRKLP